MINLAPTIYKIGCASCGALSTLPLDILQTKIICDKEINININEIKWLLLMSSIFAIQNLVYDLSYKIPSITIRGALAGLTASPIYTIFEYKKLKNRAQIFPKFNNFLIWNTIREIVLYIVMYNINASSLKFKIFFATFLANGIGYPLKILSYKYSYSCFKITKRTVVINGILEILKSTIGDGISLYLFYI